MVKTLYCNESVLQHKAMMDGGGALPAVSLLNPFSCILQEKTTPEIADIKKPKAMFHSSEICQI